MLKRISLVVLSLLALAVGSAFADAGPGGPFAQTVHSVASITYKDGTQQSWTWDRGVISALSSTSITLTRRDRQQVTFAITPSTIVRNDHATYQLSDLKVGLVATVISQGGNASIIRRLRGDGAPAGNDPSAIEGPLSTSVTGTVDATSVEGSTQSFEFDRGLVTAFANGQLTLKRADGQSLSLTVDSTTFVRDCDGRVGSPEDIAVGKAGIFFSQSGVVKLVGCLHVPKVKAAGSPAS